MDVSLKRMGMFGLFLPATVAMFWPYLLTILAVIAGIATLTIDGSIIQVLLAQTTPSSQVMTIFLLPAYLLFSLPYLFATNGGLNDQHLNVLNHLMSSGIYTTLGIVLTFVISANIIGWSAYALKKTFDNSWEEVAIATSFLIMVAITISYL